MCSVDPPLVRFMVNCVRVFGWLQLRGRYWIRTSDPCLVSSVQNRFIVERNRAKSASLLVKHIPTSTKSRSFFIIARSFAPHLLPEFDSILRSSVLEQVAECEPASFNNLAALNAKWR